MTGSCPFGGDEDVACAFRKIDTHTWLVRYEGEWTTLPDSKGAAYINYLLRRQGEAIPVARMLADVTGDIRIRAAGHGTDLLDVEGKRRLGRRLEELVAEKKAIQNNNDIGRTEDVQKKIDAIVAFLNEGRGLGGRTRRVSDDVARLYRAVRGRIKHVIKILLEAIPRLGKHLDNCLKTGRQMAYRPEVLVEWDL